jgi:heme-degrading monooxygenase HmoA
MIAVIFETFLNEGKHNDYFDLASQLKPVLLEIKGFISIERFQSINDPGKLLSLSFWKDEDSVEEWRKVELHRHAQKEGRQFIFKDYRLRVANVTRDYSMTNRKQAPTDSNLIHQR